MTTTESPQATKPKRRYRRITIDVVKRTQAESMLQGNGAAAVRVLEPGNPYPRHRASAILAKGDSMTGAEYIDKGLDQMGKGALDRVASMIQSADERIATKNAHFVIDHVRGKAVQRTENKNFNLTIEAVLQ